MESIIGLLHKQRKYYEDKQKFHYRSFVAFALILLLDFIIIMGTRKITLDAYSWAGIIFLIVLMAVEAKQYKDCSHLMESVDNFYLRGEYESKS